MLGLEGEEIHQSGNGWSPVYVEDNLGVMSIGFMLSNKDDPIIWRGPRKNSLIKQFLKVCGICAVSLSFLCCKQFCIAKRCPTQSSTPAHGNGSVGHQNYLQ